MCVNVFTKIVLYACYLWPALFNLTSYNEHFHISLHSLQHDYKWLCCSYTIIYLNQFTVFEDKGIKSIYFLFQVISL